MPAARAGQPIAPDPPRLVCIDVGSTWTKGSLVETTEGRLLATASHPTTLGTDVLDGLDAVLAALGPAAADAAVLACSSAGGGLRLGVVGYERAVTAEAGMRVGLSAGSRVCHVSAGPLDEAGLQALWAARPDVILLVGGTDGGNQEVLLHNAGRLARSRLRVPVVAAGNAEAAEAVRTLLVRAGKPIVLAPNVLPEIGAIEPHGAREAIREVFLSHVIGGKRLSRGPRFAALVRAATPDAVLAGVELLADGAEGVPGAGDVLVVDVGGATTDVYSVITPEGEDAVIHREVVGTLWRARTVEGDLGVRWSAPGVVAAAEAERLLEPAEAEWLGVAAAHRAAAPELLPVNDDELAADTRLAELAVTVALRRHARPPGPGGRGRDLRRTAVVVGSGGVLRHATPAARARVLRAATGDVAGGWRLPESARVSVDARYVLAAAGLMAASYPLAAARLLRAELLAR